MFGYCCHLHCNIKFFVVKMHTVVVEQKSISVWTLKSQKSGSLYRDPSSYSTPPRRRLSRYWHETVDAEEVVSLDKSQLDRQEACAFVLKFLKCRVGFLPWLKLFLSGQWENGNNCGKRQKF